MIGRMPALRMLARELNASSASVRGTDEKSPSYQISPFGAFASRVLIAGTADSITGIGEDGTARMMSGRLTDASGGTVWFTAGRFQEEAAREMAMLKAGTAVAVYGKIRAFQSEKGVQVSVRAESVSPIDAQTEAGISAEAVCDTWKRMLAMRSALGAGGFDRDNLMRAGFSEPDADAMVGAVMNYGVPDSAEYFADLRRASERISALMAGDSAPAQPAEGAEASEDEAQRIEGRILEILTEQDAPMGVLKSDLIAKASAEGISEKATVEAWDGLMSKGLAYEPDLKHIRAI